MIFFLDHSKVRLLMRGKPALRSHLFIESNPDPRELKRALAVRMTLQGYPHRKIMPILQVSSGFISKWKQEFIFKGVEGLKLSYQGSVGYLSSEEKKQVLAWLREKNSWNLNELECYLASEFDVTFAKRSSYYDLFHEAGISWKKSQKKNPNKDVKAVAEKKEERPRAGFPRKGTRSDKKLKTF